MHTFKLKTYRIGFKTQKHHFFILSKGYNAGKPLENPCPNCFILMTETEEEKNFYFWLCYGLWQARGFYEHLIGSVIPFLKIGDARSVLLTGTEKALKDRKKYMQSLSLLQDFENKKKVLERQIQLIREVKRAIMIKILLE